MLVLPIEAPQVEIPLAPWPPGNTGKMMDSYLSGIELRVELPESWGTDNTISF